MPADSLLDSAPMSHRADSPAATPSTPMATPRWRWLPPIGSRRYYILRALLGSLVLGPLGGVAASYLYFSIGFSVDGQALAGILGSVVTLGYGREGKPGANCMQTAAASVAGMAGMRVLIQAMGKYRYEAATPPSRPSTRLPSRARRM